MSAENQTRLVGEPSGDHVSLDTSGRRIRPALAPVDALVNECKLHVEGDSITTTVVEPANVALAKLTIHRAAFDEFVLVGDTFTTGLPLADFTSALSSARLGKRTDDPVQLDLDQTAVTVGIEREYAGTTVSQESELLTIDPDSIRQEPDIPTLDLPATATISPQALVAAVEHVDTVSDHATITVADRQLVIAADTEDARGRYGTAVTFDTTVEGEWQEPPASTFSLDYLKDMAPALVDAKVDAVDLRFGDNFPAYFDFDRDDDGDTLYEGRLMLAPRVTDDGGVSDE